MKQVCDLRRGRCPVTFGDQDTQAKWEQSCRDQEQRMRDAGIQYSPAPLCPLTLPASSSGAPKRVIEPGEPLTLADLVGTGLVMWRLVEASRVLKAELATEDPSAA
jgi:hypothetical protein